MVDFVKKWGIRLLAWIMRALVWVKKAATFLVFSLIRPPATLVWRALIFPLLTVTYSAYRRMRKLASSAYTPARGAFRNLLTGRHIVPVLTATIALLVTGNSIYANEIVASPDAALDGGILAETTRLYGEEEMFTHEAVAAEVLIGHDVSYLSPHALSMRDYYPADDWSAFMGSGDGMDAPVVSHIVSAVRPYPWEAGVAGEDDAVPGIAAPMTRTQIVVYTVTDGDTISTIARRFGLNTSTILWENNLNSWSVIRPGQTLRILPDDGVSYRVRSGDTVVRIASTRNISAESIREANGLGDAAMLQVGQVLVLPGARPPAAVPAPAPRPTPAPSQPTIAVAPPPSTAAASAAGMIWPTEARRITQYYGPYHGGVDIAGPMGTPIYAATDGTVIFSGWNSGGYGNMIIIDHGGGLYTRYAHATRNLVSVGARVSRGDTIALMGSTGRSTGPHLHFEVMRGSTTSRVNPLTYVR